MCLAIENYRPVVLIVNQTTQRKSKTIMPQLASSPTVSLKGAYRATGDLIVLMQLGTLFQGSH